MAAPATQLRPTIDEIAASLRGIHKQLIEVARTAWRREHGTPPGPFELFRMLTSDARFGWLRPLTELMAAIDELRDRPAAIAPRDASAVRAEIEDLLVATEGDRAQFRETYLEILQADPDMVVEHGRLMTRVRELPAADEGELADLLRVRHEWAVPRTRRTSN